MRRRWLGWLCLAGLLGPQTGAELLPLLARARQHFTPLPARMDRPGQRPTEAQIELGRRLFYEKQLSFNGTQSCNTCHDLTYFGQDGRPTSPGAVRGRGSRNAPSVYGAALHKAQFWDGRSPDVEDQARFPILNEIEMGMPTEKAVMERLQALSDYPARFARAFPRDPQPFRWHNLLQALGAFERGLVTPAPFDRYLQGDETALDAQQLKGLELFLKVGCAECHTGPALGGMKLSRLGNKHEFVCSDRGLAQATGRAEDEGLFKVSSLRNVAETGPYYHDGQVASLQEAVRLMAHHETGTDLTPQQLSELCDFLTSLTGTPPAEYIKAP